MTGSTNSMDNTTINVTVNGTARQIGHPSSVADLVDSVGLTKQAVAVEVNRVLVPKKQHAAHFLQSDDCIELVTLVGGG